MNRTERAAISLAVVPICRCGGNVLLGLARCGVCRRPAAPDAEELALMLWLDEQYLASPFVARPGEGRGITDGGGAAPGRPSA